MHIHLTGGNVAVKAFDILIYRWPFIIDAVMYFKILIRWPYIVGAVMFLKILSRSMV